MRHFAACSLRVVGLAWVGFGLAACQAAPPPGAVLPSVQPVPSVPSVPPAAQLSAGDAYAPELGNLGYEVARYDLRVALDPDQAGIIGQATLTAHATLPELAWVSLDFVGFAVRQVQVNGVAGTHQRVGRKLWVRLPAVLAKGEAFALTVAYDGEPVCEKSPFVPFIDHLGLQRGEGAAFAVCEPDGARYWFPCNDHPTDKAVFHVEVAVPAGLTGVSNGVLLATRLAEPDALGVGKAGDVFVWEMRQPMATYLATVVAARLVRVEGRSPAGVKLRHYVPAALAPAYAAMNPRIGVAVDWMGKQFCPYPFDAFGYVVVPGFGNAFEAQSMVIMGLPTAMDEDTLIHELAHQWFGNWVTPASWQDMWFNEGFAVFLASRAWPARGLGLPEVGVAAVPPSRHPLGHPPRRQLFGQVTYEKGADMVAALRQEMGEAALMRGLAGVMARYGGRSMTRTEFEQAMADAAGRPLTAFFARWLDEAR